MHTALATPLPRGGGAAAATVARLRPAAAFVDVDRTLLRGSSFLALAPALRAAGLVPRRTLLRAAARQVAFTLRGARAASLEGAALAGAAVVAGMDAQRLHTVGRSAVPERIVPRIHREALAAIDWHRRRGDLVFLVSSAPEEIVAPLAGLVGAEGYECSRVDVVDGRYSGRLLRLCHGEGKAQAVRDLAARHGVDLRRSTAYADSAADVPMLNAVGRAVCVNPDAELRAVAARRGWEVRHFTGTCGRRGRVSGALAAVAERLGDVLCRLYRRGVTA